MKTVADMRREGAVVVSTGRMVYTGHLERVTDDTLVISHPRGITPAVVPLSAIRMVRPLAKGEKL